MGQIENDVATKESEPRLSCEQRYLIGVLRAFLNDREPPEPPEEIDERKFERLAKRQRVVAIVADELKKSPGVFSEQTMKRFAQLRAEQIVYACAFEETVDKISAIFEENGLRYLPLKGAIMKNYYPFSYQRPANDYDVLLEEKDLERAKALLVENLDYYEESTSPKHICLFNKFGLTTVELHRALFGRANVSILDDQWNAAIRVDDDGEKKKFEHRLSNEDFYLFMVSHLARHWLHDGITIHAFVDVWIFNKKFGANFDRASIDEPLRKQGILTFVRNVERATQVWFGDLESDGTTEKIARQIFNPQQQRGWIEINVNPDPFTKKRGGWRFVLELLLCRSFFELHAGEIKEFSPYKRISWILYHWAGLNFNRLTKRGVWRRLRAVLFRRADLEELRNAGREVGFDAVRREK